MTRRQAASSSSIRDRRSIAKLTLPGKQSATRRLPIYFLVKKIASSSRQTSR
jgi:hypothetical protein